MCLNCGCMMTDDTMGDDRNVTTTMLAQAAIASGQDGKATLENTKKALEVLVAEELDKKIEDLKGKGEK